MPDPVVDPVVDPEVEPASEYENRLQKRTEEARKEEALYLQLGNVRLASVLAGIAVVWWGATHGISAILLISIAFAVLIALFVAGDRIDRRVRRARRAVTYYERALERVRHRRNGAGETGERFIDPQHPYAVDLDLFGRHSVFQLLSVCRTEAGENLLARWLLHAADEEEIRSRQEAGVDLRDRLDLREDLAVLGDDFATGGKHTALSNWASAEPTRIPGGLRWVAGLLSFIGLLALGWWVLSLFGDTRARAAIILIALIEGAFFFRWRKVVNHITASVEEPGHDLSLLRDVLARVEKESFTSSRLRELRATLEQPRAASEAIGQLQRLVELVESRENWLVQLFGPLVLWTTQVSFAVELWRQKHGPAIPVWLEAIAEFEALSSLAAAHFEHPSDVLPEVVSGEKGFIAEALAHPLLEDCVPNDITLGGSSQLLIVSGSNMSGKSTWLRTVGTNAVLALAGAPVRAKRMHLRPMSIGASIRTSDSLEGGISRFYAEILRIRQILDLNAPALFLLDELLAGTNSHDRKIGAEAILHGLLDRGAIGFATTHDLALSVIADSLPQANNVHFEDSIEDGRIRFDYRMRPGVVTRSNALELMRAVGLRV